MEMAQRSRALAALGRRLSLSPSTPLRQFQGIQYSQLWPVWAGSYIHVVHIEMNRHTHRYTNIKEKRARGEH